MNILYFAETITTAAKRVSVARHRRMSVASASSPFTLRLFREGTMISAGDVTVQQGFLFAADARDPAAFYDAFEVVMPSGSQAVVIYSATDEASLNAIGGTIAVSPASAIAAGADVASTAGVALLLAANPSRKFATVGVVKEGTGAADGTMRVGDSAITATRGAELEPGANKTYHNTGAIYGVRGTATTGSFWVEEET